jgi:hypothetical protein
MAPSFVIWVEQVRHLCDAPKKIEAVADKINPL